MIHCLLISPGGFSRVENLWFHPKHFRKVEATMQHMCLKATPFLAKRSIIHMAMSMQRFPAPLGLTFDKSGFAASIRSLKTKTFHTKRQAKRKHIPFLTNFYQKKIQLQADFQTLKAQYTMARLVSKTPEHIRPYLELTRVDKPIGTWLLYLPCVYGICMATPPGELPNFYYLALFGIGSFLMRGAGCIINDLWDKDFDKQVERTRIRPIASGKISEQNAIKLLACQLSLSLGILLSLNMTCIQMGVAAMVPVVLYPLAKRFTMFPQAVLGLTFNVGALMGYAAVCETLNWTLMGALYASCFTWTIYYDTIYAFQDVEDDKKAGVKSIALLFRKVTEDEARNMLLIDRLEVYEKEATRTRRFLYVVGGAHLVLLTCAGAQIYLDGPFYLAQAIAVGMVISQVINFHPRIHGSCWQSFAANRNMGLVLALGIAIAIALQPKLPDEMKAKRIEV